jgi:hypothetical protein
MSARILACADAAPQEPPAHALWAGQLDVAAFQVGVPTVAAVVAALRTLQRASGEDWPLARDTLATLLGNLASSAAPKFRSLRTRNAALQARLLRHAGARALLLAVGFAPATLDDGEPVLLLPPDAPLAPSRAALARLQAAQALTDDTRGGDGDGGGSAADTPEEAAARRYQKAVHHCAACAALINDGSERAWTGRYDMHSFACTTHRNLTLALRSLALAGGTRLLGSTGTRAAPAPHRCARRATTAGLAALRACTRRATPSRRTRR